MSQNVNQYTPRQYMIKSDFEFFHYKDTPNLVVEYHNHDFYEIYFYISGKVTYVIEGKSYSLKPGDIILINNREFHNAIVEPGTVYERYVIWIRPDFLKNLSTSESDLTMCFDSTTRRTYNLLRPGAEMLAHLKTIVLKLEKASKMSGYGHDILKNIYLQEFIIYLNDAYSDSGDTDIGTDVNYNKKISEIIGYINSNLANDLSLDLLSSIIFTSKYHLSREFKKSTGYTIHHYINKKRLILARDLLKENIKVNEVTARCGFGVYTNFIRAFKKEFGVSPKNYHK